MKLIDLIKATRSYRRFDASCEISVNDILHLIEHARLSASARNQQSLKYVVVRDAENKNKIFPLLKWAGYLKNWEGPELHQRPSAYIIVCNDTKIASNHFCDEGIAMQSILLAATEKELGGCIIAAFDKTKVRNVLNIPQHLDLLNIVALGKPAETIVLDDMSGEDYQYYRDQNDVHHVPKRSMQEIVIESI